MKLALTSTSATLNGSDDYGNMDNYMCAGTDIEKVKKDAPIVGLTFLGNTFPTCRMIREVFPTPERETVYK